MSLLHVLYTLCRRELLVCVTSVLVQRASTAAAVPCAASARRETVETRVLSHKQAV